VITDDEAIRLLELVDPARVDDHAPMLEPGEYREAMHARRIAVTLIDSEPKGTPAPRGRRRAIIVGAAAVVVIVVSALVLVARDDPGDPKVPAAPPPATGDLIVSMWSHPLGDPQAANVHVRVYADGRYLRNRQANWTYTDSAANEGHFLDVTGWQQRRLTPEGVELLRSEISASGLFDPDQPDPYWELSGQSVPQTFRGIIEVFNGDTPVEVHCCPSNDERLIDFQRLRDRLRDPESWLPPSAWADPESTPYVASWYQVCLSYLDLAEQPIEPSHVISVLPAAAQDSLNSARPRNDVSPQGDLGNGLQARRVGHCFDLDADNAYTVTAALDAAGSEKVEDQFFYRFETDTVVGTVDISISPYLPQGVADCGCSG
jgi:hypothetical protein